MTCFCCCSLRSQRFRAVLEQRTRNESQTPRHFHFLDLVSFLVRPKPRIPFLGLFLLRNQTETLATQAIVVVVVVVVSSLKVRAVRFTAETSEVLEMQNFTSATCITYSSPDGLTSVTCFPLPQRLYRREVVR